VEIARILKDEGYLANFKVVEEKGKTTLRVFLRYSSDRRSVITDLKRISRPGSRR
jgi:small subunit ribosomal protein S8